MHTNTLSCILQGKGSLDTQENRKISYYTCYMMHWGTQCRYTTLPLQGISMGPTGSGESQAMKSLPDPGASAPRCTELQGRGLQDVHNARIEGEPLIYIQIGYKLLLKLRALEYLRRGSGSTSKQFGSATKRAQKYSLIQADYQQNRAH